MNATTEPTPAVRASVDRLYWNSGHTVDELTARLGMTRHTLYACVNPLAAGADCERCGETLVFANRSSRTSRRARCTGCGSTIRLPEDISIANPEGASSPPAHTARRRGWRLPVMPRWAAALGVVVAAAAVEVALRRA